MRRLPHAPLKPAQWIGTPTGVAGAVLSALYVDSVAAGFAPFRISSARSGALSAGSAVIRAFSCCRVQGVFTAINRLGICRSALAYLEVQWLREHKID